MNRQIDQLSMLFRVIPDYLLYLDEQMMICDYKAAHHDTLALAAHAGARLTDILPEAAAPLSATFAAALEHNRATCRLKLHNCRFAEAHFVRSDEAHLVLLLRDITEQTRATEALRESEARYRQLFIQANRRAQELELIDKVQRATAAALDLNDVLMHVAEALGQYTGYDYIMLGLIEAGQVVVRAHHGYRDTAHLPHRFPIGQGVSGQVAATGAPLLVAEVKDYPNYLAAADDVRSEICVPFFVKAQCVGVLNVETRHRQLTQSDLEFLMMISEQVSLATERATLYNQVQLDLRRTRALYRVSRATVDTPELAVLMNEIADSVLEALSARWCVIYKFDTETEHIEEIASRSLKDVPLNGVSYSMLKEGLAGWVIAHQTSALSPKHDLDSRESAAVQQLRHTLQVGSVLVTPLIWQGKVLGVITALNHQKEPDFTQDDVAILTVIASQVTIALKQRQLLAELEHQAYHDVLTGLPNRTLFQRHVERAILNSQHTQHPFAILLIDLDAFKHVNDTLGHHVGDELLTGVAERLLTNLRAGDILARMGGDEFAILLSNLCSPSDAIGVAEKVLALFARPLQLGARELFITASIGVSVYPEDGRDSSTLLSHADSAMYQAKRLGKNEVSAFTPQLIHQAKARLALETDLRHAQLGGEFTLHYQPQVDLCSGQVVGVEALLRWQHRSKGFISPAEFIPLAEETGLIIPIGEWVLKAACRQNAAWQRAGLPRFKVAVNISAVQFARPNFVQTVTQALEESRLAPEYLELEVTESVVMHDIEQVAQKLVLLRNMGVHIAIDDFGTGYSSLRYLQNLPIDSLKIDRSFVMTIGERQQSDAALVSTIVTLAKALELTVIAEGLETEAQLNYLRSIGYKQAQGFFFSKPLPAKDIAKRALLAPQRILAATPQNHV
jgi:diguanylate cyclase (GGDEF)-like protein